MTDLRIGEVAYASGIKVETLRYYERVGLLPPAARRPSGYRSYPPETVGRLGFIRRAKELGFSLEEIKQLLMLQDETPRDRAKVKTIAEAKVAELGAKLRDLTRMRDVLARLAGECSGRGPARSCPIIESLTGENNGARGE